eukprot:TRINITY_DN65011_c0_g1_i1.p1 TRINITY_DN65011_c0_g1~~TRINITY_DN65011_c0_g1_i1.p1  ORF type:complete len:819 (+),score=204.01 TRINITY_DN65011_c0_g1_i1:112-2457(+)
MASGEDAAAVPDPPAPVAPPTPSGPRRVMLPGNDSVSGGLSVGRRESSMWSRRMSAASRRVSLAGSSGGNSDGAGDRASAEGDHATQGGGEGGARRASLAPKWFYVCPNVKMAFVGPTKNPELKYDETAQRDALPPHPAQGVRAAAAGAGEAFLALHAFQQEVNSHQEQRNKIMLMLLESAGHLLEKWKEATAAAEALDEQLEQARLIEDAALVQRLEQRHAELTAQLDDLNAKISERQRREEMMRNEMLEEKAEHNTLRRKYRAKKQALQEAAASARSASIKRKSTAIIAVMALGSPKGARRRSTLRRGSTKSVASGKAGGEDIAPLISGSPRSSPKGSPIGIGCSPRQCPSGPRGGGVSFVLDDGGSERAQGTGGGRHQQPVAPAGSEAGAPEAPAQKHAETPATEGPATGELPIAEAPQLRTSGTRPQLLPGAAPSVSRTTSEVSRAERSRQSESDAAPATSRTTPHHWESSSSEGDEAGDMDGLFLCMKGKWPCAPQDIPPPPPDPGRAQLLGQRPCFFRPKLGAPRRPFWHYLLDQPHGGPPPTNRMHLTTSRGHALFPRAATPCLDGDAGSPAGARGTCSRPIPPTARPPGGPTARLMVQPRASAVAEALARAPVLPVHPPRLQLTWSDAGSPSANATLSLRGANEPDILEATLTRGPVSSLPLRSVPREYGERCGAWAARAKERTPSAHSDDLFPPVSRRTQPERPRRTKQQQRPNTARVVHHRAAAAPSADGIELRGGPCFAHDVHRPWYPVSVRKADADATVAGREPGFAPS